MVHGFLSDNVNEDQINEIYNGYSYVIPGEQVQSYEHYDYLSSMVPVDTANKYRSQFELVSKMYKSLIPDTDKIEEYDLGMILLEEKVENQIRMNKDSSRLYPQSTFRNYIRRFAKDNNITEKQEQLKNEVRNGIIDNLPNNKEEATRLLLGDAVAKEMEEFRAKMSSDLIPIGPTNNYGTPVIMTDELSKEFELRRGAFLNSIMNPPTT
jgi:hypothetical protein